MNQNIFSPEVIFPALEAEVSKVGLPDWLTSYECSECGAEMTSKNIRGIGFKTNAQHIRNVAIEVFCTECSCGYELHFRKSCETFKDFLTFLQNGKPEQEPVPDHKIPPQENNLVEIMMRDGLIEKNT